MVRIAKVESQICNRKSGEKRFITCRGGKQLKMIDFSQFINQVFFPDEI